MGPIILLSFLIQLQVLNVFSLTHSHTSFGNEAFYTPLQLQNLQSGYKPRTVYTYTPPASKYYNYEIVTHPEDKNWKKYVAPLLNDDTFINPGKTDYVYKNQPLSSHQPISGISTSWTPYSNSVVVKSPDNSKSKMNALKLQKASLSEALKLANVLYQGESRNHGKTQIQSKPQKFMPNKNKEVTINLGTENKKIGKTNIGASKIFEQQSTNKDLNSLTRQKDYHQNFHNEGDAYMNPEHVLKSANIKLQETHLSEHDSIVEVLLDKKHSYNEIDQLPVDCKQENFISDNTLSPDGMISSCPCKNSNNKLERPIIKNRFVVLHLKDGEKMIRDPLIKFLAKV